MSTATNELQPAVSCIRQRFESQFSLGCLDTTPAPTFTNRKKSATPQQPLGADGSSVSANPPSAVTTTPGPENRKRALPPTKPKPTLSTRSPTVTMSTSDSSVAHDDVSLKEEAVVESNYPAEVFDTPIDTASVTTDSRRTYFRYSNAVSVDANYAHGNSQVNKKVPPVPAARPSKNLMSSRSVEDTLNSTGNELGISVAVTAPVKTPDSSRLTEDLDSPCNTATTDTDNKGDFFRLANVADRDTNDVIVNVQDSCQASKKELPVPAARPRKNMTKSKSDEEDLGLEASSLSVTAAAESEIVLDNVQKESAGEISDTGVVATSLSLSDGINQPEDVKQPKAAAAAAETSNEDCLLPSQAPKSGSVELQNVGEIAPQIIVMNKKGTLNPSEKSACQPETSPVTSPHQSRPALIVDSNDMGPFTSRNCYDNVDELRPIAPASGDQTAAANTPLYMASMIDISTSQPMTSPRKTSVDDIKNKHSRSESSSGISDSKGGSKFELLLKKAKKALRLDASRKTRDEGESKKADLLVPATAAASISAQPKMDVRPARGVEAVITSTVYSMPALGPVPLASKTDDVKITYDAAAPSTSVEPLPVFNNPPHADEVSTQNVANDDTRKANHPDRGPRPVPPVRQTAKVGSSMTDLSSSGSSALAQQSQVTMTSFQLEDKHRSKSLDIDQIGDDDETTTRTTSRQHNAIDRKSSSFNARSKTDSSSRQVEVVRTVDIIGRESNAPTDVCPETRTSRDSDEKSSTVCTLPSQLDICCAKELKLTAEVEEIAEPSVNPATETQVINQRRPTDNDMLEKPMETLPDNASKGDADVQPEAEQADVAVAQDGLSLAKAAVMKRRSRNLPREQSRQNFSLYITNNFEFLTEFEVDSGDGDEHQSNNAADDHDATEIGKQVKAEELRELSAHENVSSDNCATVGVQSSDATIVGVEPSPSGPKDRARLIRSLQPMIVATSRESYARLSKLIGSNFNFLDKFEFDDQLETESATDDVGDSSDAPTGSDDVTEAISTLSGNVCLDGHGSSDSTPSDGTATDCRPSAKRLEALRRHSRQSADDFDDDCRKRLSLGSVAAIDTVGAAFSFLDIDAAADDV